jgi:hypothetical protein
LTGGIVKPKKLMTTVVHNVARKPGNPAAPRTARAQTPRLFFRFLISLLFFGLLYGHAVAPAYANDAPAPPLGPGLTFAFADFDGDRRPDLASVQTRQNTCGSSDYSIQIQLSDVGRQWIHLLAPVGGLVIEARDVDGNHTIDLVLSTAWRKQPVAIFLNDGHGTFSRAEPAAFPGAFSERETNFLSGSNPATDALGISPQPDARICPEDNDSGFDPSPTSLIPFSTSGFPPDSFLTSHSGRAPPSAVLHS